MKTRRDKMIQDALMYSAERWWLERHADEDFVLICSKSRFGGRVFRFRSRPSSAIVRGVQRRWEREQLLEPVLVQRAGRGCPPCVEARSPA